MLHHRVLKSGSGLSCALCILACVLCISACGVAAVHLARPSPRVSGAPLPGQEAATTPAPVGSCSSGSAFALSLASDRGGQPTPVKAAYWFARHGGVPGIPSAAWRQVSRGGKAATVKSGHVTLHVVEGPDRTWQVDSGEWCS